IYGSGNPKSTALLLQTTMKHKKIPNDDNQIYVLCLYGISQTTIFFTFSEKRNPVAYFVLTAMHGISEIVWTIFMVLLITVLNTNGISETTVFYSIEYCTQT
ncbi:hypothetical protein ACJX0J_012257, partial [Zea mays]